jgi:hypothetical protein
VTEKLFLLSPAKTTGKRAQLLLNGRSPSELAARLRSAGAPIGDVFAFLSGLYFRGKLHYARTFAHTSAGKPGAYVITSSGGLMPIERHVTLEDLEAFAEVSIRPDEARYVEPLRRSALELRERLLPEAQVILLGSIATPKYVDPLLQSFGPALLFPNDFIGRGDMSRGGLLLRSARGGCELSYSRLAEMSVRTGVRPPKLVRISEPAAEAAHIQPIPGVRIKKHDREAVVSHAQGGSARMVRG